MRGARYQYYWNGFGRGIFAPHRIGLLAQEWACSYLFYIACQSWFDKFHGEFIAIEIETSTNSSQINSSKDRAEGFHSLQTTERSQAIALEIAAWKQKRIQAVCNVKLEKRAPFTQPLSRKNEAARLLIWIKIKLNMHVCVGHSTGNPSGSRVEAK